MTTKTYSNGLLAALVALGVSCSKKATEIPTPVVQETQAAVKNPWATYLDNIEAGKRKDPTGQYVNKAMQIPNGDGSSVRPTRPKISINDILMTSLYPQPTDPIEECPGGCPGGGPPPTPEPTSGFSSSEGFQMGVNPVDNPNNYIFNLTIIKGDQPYYPNDLQPRAGFNKIPIDLNKGAGGKTIYLCYTRYNSDVAEAPKHDPAGGINRCINTTGANSDCYNNSDKFPITSLTAASVSFIGSTNPPRWPGYDWIYNYTGIYTFEWKYPDLNDGAGGRFIYPEVTKGLRNTYPALPTIPIKEVGVLYSNDENARPPAGWEKIYQDLNEGAGGYYIYFCYKN